MTCLQQALTTAGFYTGAITGAFDQATYAAVEQLQTDRDLFVDGIAGRESAMSLGIWPDEAFARRPHAAAGARCDGLDGLPALLGRLRRRRRAAAARRTPAPAGASSTTASASGCGPSTTTATIIRSWLVSGSKYSNEMPGVHEVYSKSEQSTAWNGKAILPQMVRC